jgi:hypothetical protein
MVTGLCGRIRSPGRLPPESHKGGFVEVCFVYFSPLSRCWKELPVAVGL